MTEKYETIALKSDTFLFFLSFLSFPGFLCFLCVV